MKFTVDASAKINLFLDITGQLENGYHSLFMIMQSVSLFDTVTLEKTTGGAIELECSEPSLPCDRRNIAYKAALMFFSEAGVKNEGLRIHIKKRIPFAAGLAGGSADAAAVICGLDAMYSTRLCETALCAIGLKVGSDVPFCISGATKLVENVGEKITPLPPLKNCFIVLAKPEQGISTAMAYSAFNSADSIVHPNGAAMLAAAKNADFEAMCALSANVFEQVVSLPEFAKIRACLDSNGSLLTRMSGSGPTMYGVFGSEKSAQAAAAEIRAEKLCRDVIVCTPVPFGVRINAG